MSETSMTGRQARNPSATSTWPNTPSPSAPGHATPPSSGNGRLSPSLPPGARWIGSVRIPLTLTSAPRAHLYAIPGRPPVWFVRLPSRDGTPVWRELSRTEPLRWALASRLPSVAREAARLLALAWLARSESPREVA